MKRLKLRCYVCGKPIKLGDFALVSQSHDAVDRVFVLHRETCLKQVDEGAAVVVRMHG